MTHHEHPKRRSSDKWYARALPLLAYVVLAMAVGYALGAIRDNVEDVEDLRAAQQQTQRVLDQTVCERTGEALHRVEEVSEIMINTNVALATTLDTINPRDERNQAILEEAADKLRVDVARLEDNREELMRLTAAPCAELVP